jgi:hypothetical protein
MRVAINLCIFLLLWTSSTDTSLAFTPSPNGSPSKGKLEQLQRYHRTGVFYMATIHEPKTQKHYGLDYGNNGIINIGRQSLLKEGDEASDEISDKQNLVHDNDVLDCLEKLERRLLEGPGALSPNQVSDFEASMARILQQIHRLDLQEKLQVGQQLVDTASEIENVVGHDLYQEAPRTQSQLQDDLQKLFIAVSQMDTTTVSAMLESGLEMDEITTDVAFWAVVEAVNKAEKLDQPLSADVPRMLHHIFDADLQHLQRREKLTTNVTCMQPDDSTGLTGAARKMNYIFDDSAHKDLPLTEGRRCEGGNCCEVCSRNVFPTFATEKECCLETFPELTSLTFNNLETVSSSTILQFVRLVERVRRTISHEYGLPLSSILPLQAYSRKYVAGTTQKGGGGGEGDFVTLHTDEATHSGYHYSCVLYLSTQGQDFEGGDFIFNDPAPTRNTDNNDKASVSEALSDDSDDDDDDEQILSLDEQMRIFRYAGRKLTPFHPTRGSAVIFSSGWENMHEVDTISSGVRYTVPCFFTTCPVPEAAYQHMVVGKPKIDEDIADDWLHLLLAHQQETPVKSVGRVKELLMKWHCMCTPLSQH